MNLTKFAKLVTLGLILTVAVSACRKRPTDITVLPKSRAGAIQDVGPGGQEVFWILPGAGRATRTPPA
jgi:hypothetical protein